jgi:uncharacterized protein
MNPWDISQLSFNESEFTGVARLFPLPDLVLFPHVVQPLHIFEERYREMADDALSSDGLIALALLSPGWETEYASRPPLAPVACLGKVISHHRFPDGRYNLMLLGVRRVRVLREVTPVRAFRRAEVEILTEAEPVESDAATRNLREGLVQLFAEFTPSGQAPEQLSDLLTRELPLGVVADLVAYALPLATQLKQELLGEPSAVVRAQRLLASRSGRPRANTGGSDAEYPPPFSVN